MLTCSHGYMLTCLHAYMPTCVHAYMLTCLHAYMPTCLHAYMLRCLHAYMPTCLHAYMPTCLHAYMSTCLHDYMLTCLHKIASVRSPAARPTCAGLVCQAYSGLMPFYEVNGLSGHLHTSCHAQTMESFAVPCEISHFSLVTSSYLHPTYDLLGSKIAPSATAVIASSPYVANRGARQT